MAIIAVVGSKGGVGKTTLAINLTAGLCLDQPATLLDADPQQSASHWAMLQDNDRPLAVQPATRAPCQLARAIQEQNSHVVIDCPPAVDAEQTREALRCATLALVPVLPSPMDLWATNHIVETIAQARQHNPELSCWLVINQLESRTVLSRTARMAVEELEIPVAQTAIHRRAVYRTSLLEGRTVFHLGKAGETAQQEFNQLIQEVLIP